MKRLCIIALWVVAVTVAAGVVLPMVEGPSNGGGNSAALTACQNICLAIRIISADRATNVVRLSALSPDELREFQNLPGQSWLHGAHLLVRTNDLALGTSEPKQVIVVCDTAYSNFPQYRFWRAASHAVGYSDGSVGLVPPAEYQLFDLRGFQDISRFIQKTRVEPSAGGNAE
jgi:hypothetical protein